MKEIESNDNYIYPEPTGDDLSSIQRNFFVARGGNRWPTLVELSGNLGDESQPLPLNTEVVLFSGRIGDNL